MAAVLATVLTRFQFASTAFTVTEKEVPAVRAEGAPVLPVALPGDATSPGSSSCSFVNAPTFTVVAGEVFAVRVPFVMSVAVNVHEPAVFAVTLKVFVPATIAAFAGKLAFVSVEVMPTVSVEETTFQFASTALTVTLNAVPAVWAEGEPVLPLTLPALALSPGRRICSFAKAPALTVVEGEVLAVFVPSVASLAVSVNEPAVVIVTVKLFVPATRAAFEGGAKLASLELIAAVSVTVLTRF